MNNREANWYSHPPTCSCADCTRKRLHPAPVNGKPQPYNAKKPKKKAKHTKIHPDEWSRLLRASKPQSIIPLNDVPAAETPQSLETSENPASLSPAMSKTCPACGEAPLTLNKDNTLYECPACGVGYPRVIIEQAKGETTREIDAGE